MFKLYFFHQDALSAPNCMLTENNFERLAVRKYSLFLNTQTKVFLSNQKGETDMKKIKSLLSVILTASILLGVLSISASAKTKVSSPTNGCFYYIQHVGSGKYWDITDISTSNGARLQIWSKAAVHQNQVFYLSKVGNYWKITAFNSGKAIEVRNNSTSNNAEVAQWDYVGIASQQWSIICNSDGTVSFKNRNSGKYIDVSGNKSANGTKMVQYQSNGTKAQKFELYRIYNNDIYSAKWTRNFSNSEISWTKSNFNSPVLNYTNFTKTGYYPTPGCRYIKEIYYIDNNTVVRMGYTKSKDKSTKQKIINFAKNTLGDVITEKSVAAATSLLQSMGYSVPNAAVSTVVIKFLALLLESDKTEWNKFADTVLSGLEDGANIKGMKVVVYTNIAKYSYYGPLNNGTTAWGTQYYVDEYESYSYSLWSGNGGVTAPSGYSGYWNYSFK